MPRNRGFTTFSVFEEPKPDHFATTRDRNEKATNQQKHSFVIADNPVIPTKSSPNKLKVTHVNFK